MARPGIGDEASRSLIDQAARDNQSDEIRSLARDILAQESPVLESEQ